MERKTIYILMAAQTYREHRVIVEGICAVLEKQYNIVVRDLNTSEEIDDFINSVSSEKCQLVLNLDMTGYQRGTIGNYSKINILSMNLVNYLFQPLECFSGYFERPFTYMTSFVFASQTEYEKAKMLYPELWHTAFCGNFSDLANYLGQLDWKY